MLQEVKQNNAERIVKAVYRVKLQRNPYAEELKHWSAVLQLSPNLDRVISGITHAQLNLDVPTAAEPRPKIGEWAQYLFDNMTSGNIHTFADGVIR